MRLLVPILNVGASATLRVTHVQSLESNLKNDRPSAPYWPGKNGDLLRSGTSVYRAPSVLRKPAWKFFDPDGKGYIESTPVIDGNSTTFIGTTSGGFFALARRGTRKWGKRFQGRVMTPALTSKALFVATSAGIAHALDPSTGAELWQTQYAKDAGVDAWTVTVVDGLVLVPGRNSGHFGGNRDIVALDEADGRTRWTFTAADTVYNLMPAVDRDAVIFSDQTGSVHRLRTMDGSLQWKTAGQGPGTMCTGGLAVGDGTAYVTANKHTLGKPATGVVQAIDIRCGEVRWTQELDMEAAAAPSVGRAPGDGGMILVIGLGPNAGWTFPNLKKHSGKFVALRAETGEHLWTFEPPDFTHWAAAGVGMRGAKVDSLPDTWSNSAIDADGTVYVGWQGGIAYALELGSGRLKSKYNVFSSFQGEPAIAPGLLVVPSITHLVAFVEHNDQ